MVLLNNGRQLMVQRQRLQRHKLVARTLLHGRARQVLDGTDVHVPAQRTAVARQQRGAQGAVLQLARLVHVREARDKQDPRREPQHLHIPVRARLRHVDDARVPGDGDDAGHGQVQRGGLSRSRGQARARDPQLRQRGDELLEPAEHAVPERVPGDARVGRADGDGVPGGAERVRVRADGLGVAPRLRHVHRELPRAAEGRLVHLGARRELLHPLRHAGLRGDLGPAVARLVYLAVAVVRRWGAEAACAEHGEELT